MAFSHKNKKGDVYYLHQRKAGKGREGVIYFFSREKKEGLMNELPKGYQIVEVERTGLPVLKKTNK